MPASLARCFGVLCLALGAGAVGACKTNAISATTNNESDAIGPAGGSLTGSNGEKLIVPAGALSATTVFELSVAQPAAGGYPQNPPSGLTFAGSVFEYQPHGVQFATPATVVVPYNTTVTSPVILHAEEGDTTWTMLDVTGTTTVDVGGTSQTALEGAVSTLSYFVIAGSAALGSTAPSGCSGRGPVSGAPTGALSNFTGTYASGGADSTSTTVDLTKLVDGYANNATGSWTFEFGPFVGACGYVQNADSKIGAEFLELSLNGVSTLAVQNYPPTQVSVGAVGTPAGSAVGACGASANGGSNGEAPSGTGLTIESVDSTHVQGTFDYTPPGGTEITGTFNLPICSAPASLTPQCCLQ